MKTKLLISAAGLLLLASCAKTDLYEGGSEVPEEKSQSNAEKVFGVKFSPDQDWVSTVSGQVTVKVDASVKNVILMTKTVEAFEDPDDPTVTTRKTLKTINQAEPKGRSQITFTYDAPEANEGLFVAFITNEGGYIVRKVENGVASLNNTRTRATEEQELKLDYNLPKAENVKVAGSTTSFAGQEPQNWNPGEQLYYLNDYYYASKMTNTKEPDYSIDFKIFFEDYLNTYLPNGRDYNNSFRVDHTDAYNDAIYLETELGKPIILTPVYKHDQAERFGNEVYNSDLYYYYYNPEEYDALKSEFNSFADFVKSLPKYKAIPFKDVFGETEDAEVKKHGAYALPYFKTESCLEVAGEGTECSFLWPANYKIGFMIQAKTEYESPKKQGEIYGDGRMNNKINDWPNFKSSKLGKPQKDFSRILWFSHNDRVFMTWESGTDNDFNDVLIEVEGGKVITRIPEPDLEWFTYCFEDTQEGDYDMNDLVIKARRIDETTVEYRIVACGAYDDIYVKGLGCLDSETEVHEQFGVTNHHTFINTDGSDYDHVIGLKTVDEEFSFLKSDEQPYLYDGTTDTTVKLAGRGEGPHGIMIPTNFKYPKEKVRINIAYPDFLKWAVDADPDAELWYSNPATGMVCE